MQYCDLSGSVFNAGNERGSFKLFSFSSLALSFKGRNTAPLAFKSRLAFSMGIHVAFLAHVSPAPVTCIPRKKARRDLNASDAVFLPYEM